jgi:predicted phosphohydrolase
MNIFAIADLHLSGFSPKPMDIFGDNWTDHWAKIKDSWISAIKDDDLVLLPGDLSWAMRLSEAAGDIAQICALPGIKIIMKGNHDYWWSSLAQVQSLLSNNTYALQNNSYVFGNIVIAGTRGWTCPGTNLYDPATDEKLCLREAGRLELSLANARKKAPDGHLIGMIHYPPANQRGDRTIFTDLFEQYGAEQVIYGHLHSDGIRSALPRKVRGVKYTLVSCDALKFQVARIK